MQQYIIYSGARFTIEWYFDRGGKSPARDYFNELSFEKKSKFDYLVRRIGDSGTIQDKTKFRSEGDKLYVFKPQPDRFLCFFIKGSKIIVTNAFEKKSDKLPMREKEKALRYEQDYIKRVSEGTYYGCTKKK